MPENVRLAVRHFRLDFLHVSLPPRPRSRTRRYALLLAPENIFPATSQDSAPLLCQMRGAPQGRVSPGRLGGLVFFGAGRVEPAELAHEALKKKSGSKPSLSGRRPFRGRPISGFSKPSLLSLTPLKMSASPRQNPIWRPLEKYLRTLNSCISCHSWVLTPRKGEILSPRPPLMSPGVAGRTTSFLTMLKKCFTSRYFSVFPQTCLLKIAGEADHFPYGFTVYLSHS